MTSKWILTIVLSGFLFTSFGQQNPAWEKWDLLMGEWVGEGSGQTGQGAGTFSFKPDLDQKILVRKSHSEFPASANKPEIIHADLMVVYPDYSGSPNKAIYFDNEGHTINYSITYSDQLIVFTSEKVPNVRVYG